MIAVIDETTIEHSSGLLYVVAAVAIITDDGDAAQLLRAVVPARTRPFHWTKEGVEARQRMVAARPVSAQ